MKNKSKFGILVIIAIIAGILLFSTACGDGENSDLGTLSLGDTITSTKTGMVLTWIPAGTFIMGGDEIIDAKPYQVTLTQGFFMGITEVTQGQWRSVMGNDARLAQVNTGTNYGRGDNHPMYYVSWYDAILFCNRLSIADNLTPAYHVDGVSNWATATAPEEEELNANWDNAVIVTGSTGYRLPTEAQWEYACRAGTTTLYNTGDSITTSQARFGGLVGGVNSTIEVSSYAPNDWGLYDMHGNVWEWCWDWYSNEAYPNDGSPRTDPIVGVDLRSDPPHYMVIDRGGCWYNSYLVYLRSSFQDCNDPYAREYFTGFRVVRP